jgi:hypothetical protein
MRIQVRKNRQRRGGGFTVREGAIDGESFGLRG